MVDDFNFEYSWYNFTLTRRMYQSVLHNGLQLTRHIQKKQPEERR